MSSFWEGFLWGLVVIGIFVMVLLPIVLVVFNPLWLLLYLIEIPIFMGFVGMLDV